MAASRTTRTLARLAWFAPLLLLLLAADQTKVFFDLNQTWRSGTPATAEVLDYDLADRADITYGYVSLRVPLADGQVLTRDKLSLPHSLLPRVADDETLAVRVQPEASQEIVIEKLMPAQGLIAASQAGISLFGALFIGVGVFLWNRGLKRGTSQ